MRLSASFPGRIAACNAAMQIRDRYKLIAWNGPGSEEQRFTPLLVRDKESALSP